MQIIKLGRLVRPRLGTFPDTCFLIQKNAQYVCRFHVKSTRVPTQFSQILILLIYRPNKNQYKALVILIGIRQQEMSLKMKFSYLLTGVHNVGVERFCYFSLRHNVVKAMTALSTRHLPHVLPTLSLLTCIFCMFYYRMVITRA